MEFFDSSHVRAALRELDSLRKSLKEAKKYANPSNDANKPNGPVLQFVPAVPNQIAYRLWPNLFQLLGYDLNRLTKIYLWCLTLD